MLEKLNKQQAMNLIGNLCGVIDKNEKNNVDTGIKPT